MFKSLLTISNNWVAYVHTCIVLRHRLVVCVCVCVEGEKSLHVTTVTHTCVCTYVAICTTNVVSCPNS